MHVRVDEPGQNVSPADVDGLSDAGRVVPHTSDEVPAERHVGQEELPGEGRETQPRRMRSVGASRARATRRHFSRSCMVCTRISSVLSMVSGAE